MYFIYIRDDLAYLNSQCLYVAIIILKNVSTIIGMPIESSEPSQMFYVDIPFEMC